MIDDAMRLAVKLTTPQRDVARAVIVELMRSEIARFDTIKYGIKYKQKLDDRYIDLNKIAPFMTNTFDVSQRHITWKHRIFIGYIGKKINEFNLLNDRGFIAELLGIKFNIIDTDFGFRDPALER